MDKIIELRDLGTSLGYKDEDLRQFIREQQAIQRDERKIAISLGIGPVLDSRSTCIYKFIYYSTVFKGTYPS